VEKRFGTRSGTGRSRSVHNALSHITSRESAKAEQEGREKYKTSAESVGSEITI
jgi:hypothetical protein